LISKTDGESQKSISNTDCKTTTARPQRAAAVQGEQDRRAAAAASAALGQQLREAMGTSAGHYSTTKSGSVRLEYSGR